MSTQAKSSQPLAKSVGFAKPPLIRNISVIPESQFYIHEIPPGYIYLDEALKAYHSHCLAYEINKNGRSVLLSMDELRSFIRNGVLPSFHIGPAKKARILDQSDWDNDGPIITRIFKARNIYTALDGEGTLRTIVDTNVWLPYIPIINEESIEIDGHVVILIDDLIRVLNENYSITDSSDPENEEEVSSSRRGAPKSHDEKAFLLEAFKIVYAEGAPVSMAELIRKTERSYLQSHNSQNGYSKTPGETWKKETIRPLWHWLEAERKGR